MAKWIRSLMCKVGWHDWDEWYTVSECKDCGATINHHYGDD